MALFVQIKKKLGNFQLDVSFESQNETLALLGASGCGKSMTLKCIAGVEMPDEGRIVLNNRVLYDSVKKINLPPQKRRVGYLFQNYALFPHMTVEGNIGAGIHLQGERKSSIVAETIKKLRLEGLEKQYPAQLSGGQQQQVALARILASDPEIIMLDEPFTALDTNLSWQLEQQLLDSISSFTSTTLYVSHDLDEVYRICDRIAVLHQGKIDSINEKYMLYQNPQTLPAALITGCKNISKANRLSDYTLLATDWDIQLTSSSVIPYDLEYVGYRTQNIEIVKDIKGENIFPCLIQKVISDSCNTTVYLTRDKCLQKNICSQILLQMSNEQWTLSGEANGNQLFLRMDPSHLLLLK